MQKTGTKGVEDLKRLGRKCVLLGTVQDIKQATSPH